MTSPHSELTPEIWTVSMRAFLCLEISMPITELQLLRILPNADQKAGAGQATRCCAQNTD